MLTGVGVYSYNTGNNEAAKIRNNVLHLVKAHDWALQMHGFFVDLEEKPTPNTRFTLHPT